MLKALNLSWYNTSAGGAESLFGPVPSGQTVILEAMNGTWNTDDSSYEQSFAGFGNVTSSASQYISPYSTSGFYDGRSGEIGFPGTRVTAYTAWDLSASLKFGTVEWTVDQYWYFPTFTPTSSFYDSRFALWGNYWESGPTSPSGNALRLWQDSDRSIALSITSTFDKDWGASSIVSRDAWHWIRARREGNTLNLYIDNVLIGTGYNVTGCDFQGSTYFWIGAISGEYSQCYGYLAGTRVSKVI